MQFRIGQIDHVDLFVSDVEASVSWYKEVLGLEELMSFDRNPIYIGRGGQMLGLYRAPQDLVPAKPGLGGFRRVAWRTDREGFIAAQEKLRKHKVEFEGPVDREVANSIYFQDPDGHRLEITYYF